VTDTIRVTDSGGASATASIAVTAGLTVSPATTQAAPRARLDFNATGGSGSDSVWSFVTNGSGGSIDLHTGQYQAGLNSHTVDLVKAQDSLGNVGEASVAIGSGMGLSPASASISPRGTVAFAGFGGTNKFVWSLLSSPSGGTIDPSTAVYTAGPKGNVQDEVYAKDDAGNVATALVAVGPAILLSPATSSVAANSVVLLSVTGGSGANVHVALETNASGGSVSADFVYRAGANSGRDTIVVTDSTGSSARATIDVAAAVVPAVVVSTPPTERPRATSNNDNNSSDNSDNASSNGCSSTGSRHHSGSTISMATLLLGIALGLRRVRGRR
jgi:uncharacterized protein (TIGR03382 family)